MWRWLTILVLIWSAPVSAEEQPKVLDILDPTDIVKHYIGPKIPDQLITKFKSITPDVPGDVKLKKLKSSIGHLIIALPLSTLT